MVSVHFLGDFLDYVTGTLKHVKSSVARSLNLPVSSPAPDSNWHPVTLVAEDGLEARAGSRALGRRIVWQEPWNMSKALWRGPVVSGCGGPAVMAQEANSWDRGPIPGDDTSFDVLESSCLLSGPWLHLESRYSLSQPGFSVLQKPRGGGGRRGHSPSPAKTLYPSQNQFK